MLTFVTGRADKVLEALEEPYSAAYERHFERRASVVDMSRWIGIEALERLFADLAARTSSKIPALLASLTDQGWTKEQEGQRVTCVVLSTAWSDSLRTISEQVATEATAAWAAQLGPPVDQLTRGALRVRAEQSLALLRRR